MKKWVVFVLCFTLLGSTASMALAEAEAGKLSAYEAFAQAIDMELAVRVPDTLSAMGDNPDVGNRSSGSAAEREAAEFIRATFDEIGLQNITIDTFDADTWSFNRGRIYYDNANGEQQFMLLGGYATHLVSDMQPVSVVYAGRGTAADYEDLDVHGKVVLIDIDQREEWWISHPAIEAHNRGALAVLACNIGGYAQYDDDTIGSQDFCGPCDAATFAVSKNTSETIQALIAAGGGVAEMILDVESIVTPSGKSQNVWGEIPGKTDEVIYLMAHYDGYFHSYFDDAIGVGYLCAIAKAMVDSGYQSDKTLRFIAHGAEEWGKTDTEYDWAIGAFQQITQVRPEWAENAFAVLNLDGMYPIPGSKAYTVKAVYELSGFAAFVIDTVYSGTGYTCEVSGVPGCWTEDFSYSRAGIPAIVTGSAVDSTYSVEAYHSSMDHSSLGLNKAAYELVVRLFGAYALGLDQLAARPMNFSERFEAMREVYTGEAIDFDAIQAASGTVHEKAMDINARYAEAVAASDWEAAAKARDEGIELNKETHEIYVLLANAWTALDWEDNIIFPFEQNERNIEALNAAIACLEAGDAMTPVNELLYNVDYNWYAYDFSKETYDYNVERMYGKAVGTWGEGMIRRPNEDLYDVIHSLMEKMDLPDADYAQELSSLNTALEHQLVYREELEAELAESGTVLLSMLQAAGR